MKRYAVSYLLGGLLIALAFVTFFVDFEFTPMRDRDASWILFIGGMALALMGTREHRKELNNNGK